MRAHGLRATFVTVSLAEVRNDTWIRDRTAHKTMTMVDRYRRTARQFEELDVGSLVDLVQDLGWGISRGTLAIAVADDEHPSGEKETGSDGRIRTFVRGIKSQPVVAKGGSSVANDGAGALDEPPGPPPFTQASPTLQRLPADVQEYVAECLADAYPHAFGGDPDRVLKPLVRAAKAINKGRAPKTKRGGSR